jgi:hypothetical protein
MSFKNQWPAFKKELANKIYACRSQQKFEGFTFLGKKAQTFFQKVHYATSNDDAIPAMVDEALVDVVKEKCQQQGFVTWLKTLNDSEEFKQKVNDLLTKKEALDDAERKRNFNGRGDTVVIDLYAKRQYMQRQKFREKLNPNCKQERDAYKKVKSDLIDSLASLKFPGFGKDGNDGFFDEKETILADNICNFCDFTNIKKCLRELYRSRNVNNHALDADEAECALYLSDHFKLDEKALKIGIRQRVSDETYRRYGQNIENSLKENNSLNFS